MKYFHCMAVSSVAVAVVALALSAYAQSLDTEGLQHPELYKAGWIDLNKNGVKDVYEDASKPIDARVADLLSQMTVNYKTMQLVTLYGWKRVLQDPLPTPEWNKEFWKDGIGNIDEHINGNRYRGLDWPPSAQVKALNAGTFP